MTIRSDEGFDQIVNHNAAPLRFLVRFLPAIAMVADSLCLLATGVITLNLLVYYSYKTADTYSAAIYFTWLVTVGLLYIGGTYNVEQLSRVSSTANRIVLAVFTNFALMLAAAFSVKISQDISRIWWIVFFASAVVNLLLLRLLFALVLTKLAGHKLLARSVLIFGDHHYVKRMVSYIKINQPQFINVSAIFEADMISNTGKIDSVALTTQLHDVVRHFRNGSADDIIIALPWSAEIELASVIDKLRELPVNVYLGADLIGFRQFVRPAPDHFSDMPMFEVAGKPMSGWDVVIKTLEDYVLASFILLVLSPLLILIAIAIKLDSPGPVLFKQKRNGFNNRIFYIYKFRTMRFEPTETANTVQATKTDNRVTRVGRFLRRTSLDELPQLLNVLAGNMSLVGPRPHAADHNADYAQRIRGYFARHRVKPGITGLAQVKGYRGLTDTIEKMENRVKYDIIYTDNWSLKLDMKILLKTMWVCLSGKNAY